MSHTPNRAAHRHRAIIARAVMLVIAAALPALAVSTPSPEDVRECIELNLPRYSPPGSAVTAQYADVEASCQAGLEDGSVSVQFDPGPTDRSDATTTPDSGSAGPAADRPDAGSSNGGSSNGGSSAGAGAAPDTGVASDPATPSRPRSAPRPQGNDSPKAAASSEEFVTTAIARADLGAGSPLPSSLSGGPVWLLVLMGAAAALIVGAAARAVRRRLN